MSRRIAESVWEQRREWIGKQQESGLSVAQFCRDNGLHVGNFHAWRHRLASATSQSLARRVKPKTHSGETRPLRAFVQLPVQSVAVVNGPSWIEVSLADGMVVRVPAANLDALDTVLSSLSRTRQEKRHA
jgi:hypothetical protein